MGSFDPGGRNPYQRSAAGGVVNGVAQQQQHMGSEHGGFLAMENGGFHSPEVWFSNSLAAVVQQQQQQETSLAPSPILLGDDGGLLDDEIWPEFLSHHPAPSSPLDDVATTAARAMPDCCPLPDQNRPLLPSNACENSAEGLEGIMDSGPHSAAPKTSARLQMTDQFSSSSSSSSSMVAMAKTKTVHWPEELLLENEVKRQRPGAQSSECSAAAAPAASVKETSTLNSVAQVQRQFDTASLQSFEHNSEHVRKDEIASEIGAVREEDSHSFGVVDGVGQPGASISETASANLPECSGSYKSKDHTAHGDNNNNNNNNAVINFDMSVLGGKDSLSHSRESVEGTPSLSVKNLLSSKASVPAGQGKSGGAPKSHHVQLVERHTGLRMISTAGAFADSGLPRESRWAEELLLECALAISSKNTVRTQHLMWVLNDLGCLSGDANQRLAAHGLESLFCKMTGTGGSTPTLGQVNAGPKSVHRALLKFHDVNPWHHMAYTVANTVMIDNFEGEDRVHVIDIGVSQGTQWPTFIEALATRASGPPLLRLTVVKDEEGAGSTPGGPRGPSSADFMVQLERFAKLMGIKMEFQTVVSSLEHLTRRKLGLKEGEALAICTQFRLHRLSETMAQRAGELDEVSSPELEKSGLSPRDKFLQFMHELQPKVVILSENDTDHLDSDFITRFRPTVDYFWKFLDATSSSFHGKQSQERQIIEYEAAMAMVNNVACEGSNRIERNESHRGWTQRMEKARFLPALPREEILENIRTLVRKYDTNWEFSTDLNCVVLLWKRQPVTFCSVWKPS